MRTTSGIANCMVAHPTFCQQWSQIALLRVRLIMQLYALAIACYSTIKSLKHRREAFDKLPTSRIDILGFCSHLHLIYLKHRRIGHSILFQQRIPTLQCLIISHQRNQIRLVILRDNHIHKSASLIATLVNQILVRWRNQHSWYQPNMVGHTLIVLFVAFELFLCSAFHCCRNQLLLSCYFILALKHKKLLIVMYQLRVNCIQMAFSERKIIYRIQHIGFAHTVRPQKTIEFWRKQQIALTQIAIIQTC